MKQVSSNVLETQSLFFIRMWLFSKNSPWFVDEEQKTLRGHLSAFSEPYDVIHFWNRKGPRVLVFFVSLNQTISTKSYPHFSVKISLLEAVTSFLVNETKLIWNFNLSLIKLKRDNWDFQMGSGAPVSSKLWGKQQICQNPRLSSQNQNMLLKKVIKSDIFVSFFLPFVFDNWLKTVPMKSS